MARREGFEPTTVGSEVLVRFNPDSTFQRSPSPILARREALADGFEPGDIFGVERGGAVGGRDSRAGEAPFGAPLCMLLW